MEKLNYYLGLDIGTDSVGYAVTEEDYTLKKFKGEPLWGTTVFEAAQQAADRRSFRTARRRLDRRQQRLALLEELFAAEISKVDPRFFIRRKESALLRTDASSPTDSSIVFNDAGFTDKDFYKKYPTVHHLLFELMQDSSPHDVRLVYTAIAWLVAHRGHFLSDVDADNIENVRAFHPVYAAFLDCILELAEGELPWDCDENRFAEALQTKLKTTEKEKLFFELLFNGKKPKDSAEGGYPVDRASVIKLLSGGSAKPSAVLKNEEYSDCESITLAADETDFMAKLAPLGDDAALFLKLKALYDWSLLVGVLADKSCVSEAKVAVYNQHRDDLKNLKAFIRKYHKKEYDGYFRNPVKNNYVFYSGNFRSVPFSKKPDSFKKPEKAEEFKKHLLSIVANTKVEPCDTAFYEDMLARLETYSFLPKQVTGDNRVIPYQLYLYELNKILKNAETYLPFLLEKDADGITVSDKIRSVFLFRVPYFLGPLNSHSPNSWFVRKAEGRILPWNIETLVDYEKSEQAFIDRMTNYCTYLPGENVLPKNSLLYTKFTVLNEINNLKVNGESISVQAKQGIYNELFMKKSRVTVKAINNWLISNGYMKKGDTVSGVDESIKSSLKPWLDFAPLFADGTLTEQDAEAIIEHRTYTEDKQRYIRWLKAEYPQLQEDAFKRVASLKYKDFGRLSRILLTGITGIAKNSTGEAGSILYFMWETNNNLMELLSAQFTFSETVAAFAKEYYAEHPADINTRLDEMYISNAVKRPIFRTLDIVKEVTKAVGGAPSRIFIEMARGADEDQRNKRTKSRKEQLLALYKKIKTDDARAFTDALNSMGENDESKLQSEVLYLYYLQMGRCAYTGVPLDITKLKDGTYNVDHIWPQYLVKDDSILNNKVLVTSKANAEKGDKYPVPDKFRQAMQDTWKVWHDNSLMSDEKYRRLTRSNVFSEEEKTGFINRQLVETRQSTKAVAGLLGELYPETEIVYVKAGLVADFRHEFDCLKCREVNDLHHAKDAYLNIVTGNVYHEKFNRRWFSPTQTYSVKTKTVFSQSLTVSGRTVWNGEKDLGRVKKILQKNNIHFTRYAFMRKGGFFDQMPVSAGAGLVPRKKGLDPEKYGGYNKTTASFFILARFTQGKTRDAMIVPVELLVADRVLQDDAFAAAYITEQIALITGSPVTDVDFPLGLRAIKINTVFEIDGCRVSLASKSNGGRQIVVGGMYSLFVGKWEAYVKKLAAFNEKKKTNKDLKVNPVYDKITVEENNELFMLLSEKIKLYPFRIILAGQLPTFENGLSKFSESSIEAQVECLLQIVLLLKTGRTVGCNLVAIGGSKQAGVPYLSTRLSNWKSKVKSAYIVDVSAAGLYEKKSLNLLELI